MVQVKEIRSRKVVAVEPSGKFRRLGVDEARLTVDGNSGKEVFQQKEEDHQNAHRQ